MKYLTSGAIRGDCSHTHRTLSGAARCLARDIAGCRSQGGYSDRRVLHEDGSRLSAQEQAEVDLVLNGATTVVLPAVLPASDVASALTACRAALETLTITEQAEVIRTLSSERAL